MPRSRGLDRRSRSREGVQRGVGVVRRRRCKCLLPPLLFCDGWRGGNGSRYVGVGLYTATAWAAAASFSFSFLSAARSSRIAKPSRRRTIEISNAMSCPKVTFVSRRAKGERRSENAR